MPGFERWQRTWARLGAAPPGTALFGELIARYSEPHRKYHTVRHLDECFEKLEEIQAVAMHLGEIEIALWFHDALYEVKRHDNEAKSADWARAVSLEAGVAAAAADRARALVMVTAHNAVPADEDQRIVVDVDLSILGAPEERFDEYEVQIREEYAWVPEEMFRRKRREVLAGFLARQRIFGTAAFIDRYEARARANLARSIQALKP